MNRDRKADAIRVLGGVYDVESCESTTAAANKALFNKGDQLGAVGPCDRGRTDQQHQHVPVRWTNPN